MVDFELPIFKGPFQQIEKQHFLFATTTIMVKYTTICMKYIIDRLCSNYDEIDTMLLFWCIKFYSPPSINKSIEYKHLSAQEFFTYDLKIIQKRFSIKLLQTLEKQKTCS